MLLQAQINYMHGLSKTGGMWTSIGQFICKMSKEARLSGVHSDVYTLKCIHHSMFLVASCMRVAEFPHGTFHIIALHSTSESSYSTAIRCSHKPECFYQYINR